jgi:ParB family chromosome partitioning protein
MSRRKPLRSLSDWIGTGGHSFDSSLLENEETAGSPIQSLDIDQLAAGRYQPRRHIDEAYLAELAQSIRQFGIIEPLVARPLADGGYEILAGHMRWQAARQAGLTRIPVVVRNADDQTAAAIALVENLLRRELNPVEEGRALQRLREEFNLTQAQLAELLGISQTAISRALGLLSLDPTVQRHIEEGRLEAGHGKTLISLPGEMQFQLAEQAVAEGWSVRELERRRAALVGKPHQSVVPPTPRDPNLAQLEKRLRERLATPVRLRYDAVRGRGRIEIGFASLDECNGLLERLGLQEGREG